MTGSREKVRAGRDSCECSEEGATFDVNRRVRFACPPSNISSTTHFAQDSETLEFGQRDKKIGEDRRDNS
jgi:hypothetical protein